MTSVWPSLAPSAHLRPADPVLPYPLSDPGCRLFARARHGLYAGLRALGVGLGDSVLMPAWHHGSEVEAVLATGARCEFYEPGPDLAPDPDTLAHMLGPTTKALHLTHYLGFPQDAAAWRTWCDRHGILLIEDAAQAWLSWRGDEPVGMRADLAVWCLYKTNGLPDGAAMRCLLPVEVPPEPAGRGFPALARRHAGWAAQFVPLRRTGGGDYDPVADFALSPVRGPSPLTRRLLPRIVSELAVERRRSRYRQLLDRFPGLVPAPFDVLPTGAVPFAFPIAVQSKDTCLGELSGRGVQAVDLWSSPHPALTSSGVATRTSSWRRRTHLGLPVHQGMSGRQWARYLDVLSEVLGAAEPATRPTWVGTPPHRKTLVSAAATAV